MNDRNYWLVSLVALMFVAAFGTGVQAQNVGTAGSSRYQIFAEPGDFQHGCVPPCLCPDAIGVDFAGTLELTPTGRVGSFDTFSVQNVNWTVSLFSSPVRVTGSGTYRIDRSAAAAIQQLTLDLKIGDEPVEHLDSGLVPVTADFPAIDVTASVPDPSCIGTTVRVNAAPVSIPIPTMSTFGLMVLAMLLVIAGVSVLRRSGAYTRGAGASLIR